MAANTILSGTTTYLTVSFFDKTGAPAAPASVTWSCYDKGSGSIIQNDTAVTPGTTVVITVSSTLNTIINPQNSQETRVVVVKASYGAGDGINGTYSYMVESLPYRTA